jgi:hypothetical protein
LEGCEHESDVAANPTGGRSEGITEASNLGLDLLLDLDKLGGIKGGSFLLQLSERWGTSLSADYIGNVFTTQQVFGGESFRVGSPCERPRAGRWKRCHRSITRQSLKKGPHHEKHNYSADCAARLEGA